MIPQEADQTHIEYGFPVVLCDESCVPAVEQSGSAESTELFVETWETRKSNFQV